MTRIIILAAGKGKRMGSENLPKVLRLLRGRPMVEYLIEAVRASEVDAHPTLVIGHLADEVKKVCGASCEYALQKSLRGTGDAVRSAKDVVGNAENIMVLNGDMPFVSSDSIKKVVTAHKDSRATMTLGTVSIEDFNDWRSPFMDFGRIIRNEKGQIERITEVKDATKSDLAVKEVNPSVFCFKAEWLWAALEKLTTQNAQGEYYVTDLLEDAIGAGEKVTTVPIPPKEAIGINTPSQLEFAEKMMD